MGGELNQFLSEALAEGGRQGAEAAIRRTNQQRELGIAIAQNLANSGQFSNLDPALQQGFQKMLGKTAYGGLTQLSDINSQIAILRQGAQDVLQAPVLEETNVQVPTPQVPQGVPSLGPLPEDVTPFTPRKTVPQTQVIERAPTAAEQFQRARDNAAAAHLVGGADFARTILNEQQIELDTIKAHAKTQLQSDINSRISDLITGSKIKLQGDGMDSQILKSISVNPTTGNINYNLGRMSTEEIRNASNTHARQLMTQSMIEGTATPMEIMIGLNAKGEYRGSPADAEALMGEMSMQILTHLTNGGVPLPQAIQETLNQTGTIPKAVDDLLPENVSNEFRKEVARKSAQSYEKLSDVNKKAKDLELAQQAAMVQAKAIAENQTRPITAEERKIQIGTMDTIRQLGDMHNLFRESMVGLFRGRVPTTLLQWTGQLKDGEARFRAMTSTVQSAVIKAITGAQMGENEARRILIAVPKITDSPTAYLAKLELMMHNVSELQRIQNAIFENGGQRWATPRATKSVMINGAPVEIVAPITGDTSASDPVFNPDFNHGLEKRAGIVIMRDGSIEQVGVAAEQPDKLTPDQQSFMDEFKAALAEGK